MIKSNSCLDIAIESEPTKLVIKPVLKSKLHFFLLGALIEGFFDTSFIVPRQVCDLEFIVDEAFSKEAVVDIHDNSYVTKGREFKFSSIEIYGVSAFVNGCVPNKINYILVDEKRLKRNFVISQLLLSSGITTLVKLLLHGVENRFAILAFIATVLLVLLVLIPALTSVIKFLKFCTSENCNNVLGSNYSRK